MLCEGVSDALDLYLSLSNKHKAFVTGLGWDFCNFLISEETEVSVDKDFISVAIISFEIIVV